MLPYLLQLAVPASEHSILWMFRDAWPGWTALLCGAIGFYSGSLARDDYQGLLISAVPITALILVMYIADPNRLVFPGPFGYPQAIWKDWALALRLLIIAGVFAWLGARLLAQGQQPSRRKLLLHAVALVAITFGLTLWNVVTERSLIQRAGSNIFRNVPEIWSINPKTSSIFPPQQLATLADDTNRDFNASLRFLNEERHDDDLYFGTVTRNSWRSSASSKDASMHTFAITSARSIHEFPQSPDFQLSGWSSNGRWILVSAYDSLQRVICGPYGLAISSTIMPDTWFDRLQNGFNFSMVKPAQSTFIMHGRAIPANLINEPVLKSNNGQPELLKNDQSDVDFQIGHDDVVASVADRGIIWKDGAKELTVPEQTDLRMKWLHFGGNAFAVSIENTAGSTSTAILKPTDKYGVYKTAGWVSGDVDRVSSDYQWATSYQRENSTPDTLRVFKQLGSRAQADTAETTGNTSLEKWEISMSRLDEGTTVILVGGLWEVPVNTPSGDSHIWFSYRKFTPIKAGGQTVQENFPVESGIMVFNLKTGLETFIPLAMPWPAEATMNLQNAIPQNQRKSYWFDWPGYTWDKSQNLVVLQNGYVAIIRFKGGRLEPESMRITYSHIPNLRNDSQVVFMEANKLLTTDGTSIWLVSGSR